MFCLLLNKSNGLDLGYWIVYLGYWIVYVVVCSVLYMNIIFVRY